MTGLVRVLLTAPVAWLVAWLGAHGIGADPDVVGTLLGAVLAGLLGIGLRAAEDRWPWVRRVVGWLAREVPTLAPTGPDGVPLITTARPASSAGPSNVRVTTTTTPPVTPHAQPGVTVDYSEPVRPDQPQSTP